MKYLAMFGNSMKPTMPLIDVIRIEKRDQYKPGDIIVFKGNNGFYYCHRITWINKSFFISKGDNRDISKEYEIDVPISNILGTAEKLTHKEIQKIIVRLTIFEIVMIGILILIMFY